MMRHVARLGLGRIVSLAALVMVLVAGGAAPVAATSFSWNVNTGGLFNDSANWGQMGLIDLDGVPDANDIATFRRGSAISYTVTFPGAGLRSDPINFVTDQLRIGSNTVSFVDGTDFNHVVVPSTYTLDNSSTAEAGRGIIIGETGSDTAAVLTTRLATLSAVAATIGDATGASGTLNVSGGTSYITGSSPTDTELIIGRNGNSTGTLNVSAGARMYVTSGYGDSVLGEYSGSHGSATITGSGSAWGPGGLSVGGSGDGTLNVTAGALVVGAYPAYVGRNAGSTGDVTVNGGGSTWTAYGDLFVGYHGTGMLSITGGGQVLSSQPTHIGSYVGYSGGSTGTVSVDGAGSSWDAGGLIVGYQAAGTLNITAGGQVTSGGDYGEGFIGDYAAGTVTVDGVGSKWTVNKVMQVGYAGNGNLSITGGGEVDANLDVFMAAFGGSSSGSATITGTGSKWMINGDLSVGFDGPGTLVVMDGGQVTDSYAFLDSAVGSSSASVAGPDSKWTNTGDLSIGVNSGDGTLDINSGGQVSDKNAYMGSNQRAAVVTVDGATSKWASSGTLYVGFDGTGSLNVSGAGRVTSATGIVGNFSGSSGTARIDGAGSQWINTGDLTVGGAGTGTLTVTNSGTVSLGGLLTVGSLGAVNGNSTIIGNVQSGGVVAPGMSAGALHINGNYTQTAAGKLQIELGGTTAGTLYDQLIISGAVTLGGALQVSLINSFSPTWGNSFDILDWGTVGGVFSTLTLPGLNAGLSWNTSQLYTDGILSIMLSGDYNLNGVVDAADYVVWRKGLGTTYTQTDYDVWRAHFGQTAGGGSGAVANAAVPEPATLTLLALAVSALALLVRRRCESEFCCARVSRPRTGGR